MIMNLDELRQDFRYAMRTPPGPMLLSALTLSLGIGAATAMFSVIDGVLLKPLPVAEQEELLVVWKSIPERGFEHMPFTYASVEGMRERLRTVSGVAAQPYHGVSRAVVRSNDMESPLGVAGVTGDWFSVLVVTPQSGRLLNPADDRIGAPPVLVLSQRAAERLFGDADAAVGRTLRVNEVAFTVAGVAPRDFDLPRGAEAWAPASPFFLSAIDSATSLRDADKVAWDLVVRVAPGFTVEQTRAELTAALSNLTTESEWLGEQTIRAKPLADLVVDDVRPALLLLGAAVLLILIVAGVNVANLLLVRGLTRARELAVRAAIGASRGRILQQLATEAFVLASFGALLAIPVAMIMLRVLLALAPAELPRLEGLGVDARALAFAATVATLGTAVFGLLPALRTSRIIRPEALRAREAVRDSGGRTFGLRQGLIITQVAITVLVLSTAGLLLRSLDRMQRLDLGFAADDVVLAEVALPSAHYAAETDHQLAMTRVAERTALLPGVALASAVVTHPFAGNGGVDAIWYGEGQSAAAPGNPYSNYEGVDATYFETMGLRILHGRAIDATDRAASPRVVVVNESFARLYWPGRDPLGRRIKLGAADSEAEWHTVVGVAADARYRELTSVRPSVYVPYEQGIPVRPNYVALRTTASPVAIIPGVRKIVREYDPGAAVMSISSLPQLLAQPLARPRFQSALLVAFALMGLVLSIVGTYGVLAFFVRQRKREIGIRMALGAQPSRVRALVLHQALMIALTGVAIGIIAAGALGRFLESMLFEVSPLDPLVIAASALALLVTTIAAAVTPTRLATRTDPLLVIRSD